MVLSVLINGKPTTLHYEELEYQYKFESDIKIGAWSIFSEISNVWFPSQYRCNYENYFDITITDNKGISRIKRYYYNRPNQDCEIGGVVRGSMPIDYLAHFIENFAAFRYTDWADYDAFILLKKIVDILGQKSLSNQEQIDKVSELLKLKK